MIFTNNYSGQGTLFFHTGYTKEAAKCEISDIRFIPAEPFPKKNECASNGDFSDGLKKWNFWQITASEGSNLISQVKEDGYNCCLIKGQVGGKLMGLAQAVKATSGTVYKLSASVKSPNKTEKSFLGARVAFYINKKEKQLIWTYNTDGWEEKSLIFTNNYNGVATLYFHTGYTTNACEALFKNISLIKQK